MNVKKFLILVSVCLFICDSYFAGAILKCNIFIYFMYGMFCCSFIYAAENGNYHDIVRSWQRCWKCFYSQGQALAHHIELYSFIHSIGMYRMRRFLTVLRNFIHSSLLCTLSCHPSPPTILPSSPTSSCHLFLGLPLNLVVPKFIYNTF